MQIDLDINELIRILQELSEDQAKAILVRKCPKCSGRGYYGGYITVGKKPKRVYNSHIRCDHCNGNIDYREQSELAKVLIDLIRNEYNTIKSDEV